MKEAKKYINHHRVQISGEWYVPYERAVDAIDIALEEARLQHRGEKDKSTPALFTADPDAPQ